MAVSDGASSISVAIRVRPFTESVSGVVGEESTRTNTIEQVREAAQLTHIPEGPLFLGDGSLAGAPTPSIKQKGIRPVLKVVDDKCL